MEYTRRHFGKIALASVPLAYAQPRPNSKFGGVQIGAITYSFRGTRELDAIIKMMVESGLSEAELMYDQAEAAAGAPAPPPRGGRGPAGGEKGKAADGKSPGPPPRVARPSMTEEQIAAARERSKDLRTWRLGVSMDKYKEVRSKFDGAGIDVRLLCFNMTEAITDDEIEYAFQMAKALGVQAMSSTMQVTVSKRVAPFADKHKMMIGFHGHDAIWDPNEFATPESFATALSYSKYHGINLDIGHFTAANYDPIPYIREHHARITNLHLKDRMKDHGANVPWGEGQTPIKQVLQLLRKEKYAIPANIEYEYGRQGMDTVAEMKKCVQYCKDALA